MVKFVQVILFFFIISCSNAQNSGNQAAAWKLISYSGDISLNGQYNMNQSGSFTNNNFNYGGGINLRTSSYVWHPNFLIINAGISYDPQLAQFFSTQLPNSFSNFNTANIYLNTSFFRSLKFNFDTFLAYNKSLSSQDKLYKVEIDQIKWGASIHYDGSFKFDTTFEQINEKQNEPSQNREFVFNNSNLKGTIRKSFSDIDENYFNYQFSSNSSEQVNVYENNSINTNVDFLNTTYFPGSGRSSYFNTRIYYNNICN